MQNDNNGFSDPFGNPFDSNPTSEQDPFFDQFGMGVEQTPPPNTRKKHGLHWAQTLVVLLVAAVTSFFFSRVLDIRYSVNPTLHPNLVLFNGLFFALLAAAILITAFLIELATSAMTPHFGRKLQLLVAVIAIVLCGLVGAFGEFLFVRGYVLPQIAPTPEPVPVVTPTPTPSPTPSPSPAPMPASQSDETIIIALDKSYSMEAKKDTQSTRAVIDLLSKLTPGSQIGLIAFGDEILDTAPLAPNSAQQQQLITSIASMELNGLTSFDIVMDTALKMFRMSGVQGPKKLVFITDGAGGDVSDYVDECKAMDIQVSAVMIDNLFIDLEELVAGTNGVFTSVTDLDQLLDEVTAIVLNTTKPAPTPKPMASPTPVPTPSPTPLPKIGNLTYVIPDAEVYLAVILILEGVIIGLSLTLMLSLERQFRIQLILSPLMGLCAFLLIRYRVINIAETWMAYVLLGVVLMRRNDGYSNSRKVTPRPDNKQGSGSSNSSGFGDIDFPL